MTEPRVTQPEALRPETLVEWRRYRGLGMTSALGEYTPDEFWLALDEIDRLRAALEAHGAPAEPRFSLSVSEHGVQIWDEEPTYDDACLRVSGNFDSLNQKIEFAREVLALLNSTPDAAPQAAIGAAEMHAAGGRLPPGASPGTNIAEGAAIGAEPPANKIAMLTGAAEAMIGFAQETIGSPAAKRFDDYYVPRLREAIAALAGHPAQAVASSPEAADADRAELLRAIGELSMAMGNPCVGGSFPRSIESETVRCAVDRLKETQRSSHTAGSDEPKQGST